MFIIIDKDYVGVFEGCGFGMHYYLSSVELHWLYSSYWICYMLVDTMNLMGVLADS
jgi:hypothetical protein